VSPAMPAAVLAAALAVSLAVPVLGWSLFARLGAATVQARQNLARSIGHVGPAAGPVGAPDPDNSAGSPAG
jgi:tight adherence protein C